MSIHKEPFRFHRTRVRRERVFGVVVVLLAACAGPASNDDDAGMSDLALDASGTQDGGLVDSGRGDPCGDNVLDGLETCDIGIAQGQPGACPIACDDQSSCTVDALTGGGTCTAACIFDPIETCGDADGCCPAGCTYTNDDDCSPTCDNGTVEVPEKCDTAIDVGQHGACPTSCEDGQACTADTLLNAGSCDAHCTHLAIEECIGDDGCCPDACNDENDNDCLACGNGRLDPEETCDIAISGAGPGVCPTSCDDQDACTTNELVDAGACTARCEFTEISSAAKDGCCPEGFDFTQDADCVPDAGAEFVVTGDTEGVQGSPDTAMGEDGRFVVVWESDPGAGLGLSSIYGQRYSPAGEAMGKAFRIDSDVVYGKRAPAVAMARDGRFAVVWVSLSQDGSNGGIFGQIYDAEGEKSGGEFQVNTVAGPNESAPAVAMGDNSQFVVTWHNATDIGKDDVYARRYDSAGSALGSQFRVNSFTPTNQNQSAVSMAPGGSFVVSWYSGSTTHSGIFAQRYAADGSPQGDEFAVGAWPLSSLAVGDDGGFVAVWKYNDRDNAGVFGRRFDATGEAVGPQFWVNTFFRYQQIDPDVAINSDGQFVVVWRNRSSSFGGQISGQIYGASGARLGGEFPVGPVGADPPAVAMAKGHGFVVAWDYGGDVRARLFAPLP